MSITEYKNLGTTFDRDTKTITVDKDGEMVIKLTTDLEVGQQTTLLRVNGKITLYRVILGEFDVPFLTEALQHVVEWMGGTDVPNLLFNTGRLSLRSRINDRKIPCRTLFLGAAPIVQRDGRLVFLPLNVPGLGKIQMETTGDTSALYVQLNDLL